VRDGCPRCLRPAAFCVCAGLVPVPSRTRVVLLQHPREARLAICSAWLTRIALENVYEADPEYLGLLLDALPPGRVGFCFDTGHFNAFAGSGLEAWIDRLGSRLIEIHLHDNKGALDEHLPVGEGTFPFARLFAILREKKLAPILTVEAHSEQNLAKTLAGIKALGILEGFGSPAAADMRPATQQKTTPAPGRS